MFPLNEDAHDNLPACALPGPPHQRWRRDPFFPYALEIAQPSKDAAADGALRTLSRIDRAFIDVPMAEARDFHCHSHVTDNLVERSIPRDHVAIRVVV